VALREVTSGVPEGFRNAQDVARATVAWIAEQPLAGSSEAEIAALIDGHLSEAGVTETWCPTLVGIGEGTVVCHPDHRPSAGRTLEAGGIVWADVTPVLDGWYGDITRVWFAGEPSPADAKLVHDAEAILEDALAFVQPGMEARELFLHTKGLIDDGGYRLCDLLGNIGHDLGRDAYSQGFIDATNHTPMWGGWAIEPHIGLGDRGAKFEDIVWLSTAGRELV
jgi:Xaa-Pro aminopeptidase